MPTPTSQPLPIEASLNYTREQAQQLNVPHATTAEVRPLLRRFHDDLVAAMAPQLATLRADGLIVDHATSWLLGEFVAHVPADRAAEAEAALGAVPQLKGVRRGIPPKRGGRR